jgi:hypothetical protein
MNAMMQMYKKLPVLFRYSLWLALCCVAAFLFQLSGQAQLHVLPLAALALGILLFVDSPLAARGMNSALESGIAAALIIGFIVHFGMVVIVPIIEAEDLAGQPCNERTLSMRCYSTTRDNCQVAWARFENDCRSESLSIRQNRPTSLLGPVVKKCTLKKMDQAFRSTRRMTPDSDCQNLFTDLDTPVF